MTHPTTLFPITAKSGSQIGRLPEKSSKGKRWKLEEVERWTMVKRIW